ncbi:hypothetical protein Q3G72_011739 [Acer saccharum]|nr:hypothetical protein Q3G72_011739 [Acer saccharum]
MSELETEPHLVVHVAVGLEDERVALNGLEDFAAAGEAKFAVELAGIVETEDALGLFGEELLGLGEESEGGVTALLLSFAAHIGHGESSRPTPTDEIQVELRHKRNSEFVTWCHRQTMRALNAT